MKNLNKYLELTEKALKEVKVKDKQADALVDMARRYFEDAKHFLKEKKEEQAFAAVNYSHAMLDAAALLGWLDNKDSKLFMVD